MGSKLTQSCQEFKRKTENMRGDLSTNSKILARFDEVLTEKASKISLEENIISCNNIIEKKGKLIPSLSYKI